MVKIFIILMAAIFGIAILIGAAVAKRNKARIDEIDRQYYDTEGNHLYYDRSIIEKEDFRRKNPEEGKRVRTFGRLFSNPKEKD